MSQAMTCRPASGQDAVPRLKIGRAGAGAIEDRADPDPEVLGRARGPRDPVPLHGHVGPEAGPGFVEIDPPVEAITSPPAPFMSAAGRPCGAEVMTGTPA